MGGLSDIGDSIASAVDNRGLFGSVHQEFKRFANSDLGKAALLAAAVYFGGGMAGWWTTPLSPGVAAAGGAAQGATAGAQAATLGGVDAAAPQALLASGDAAGASAAPWGPANFGAIDQAAPLAQVATPATVTPVASSAPLMPPASVATGGMQGAVAGAQAGATPAAGNWFTGLHPLAQYGLLNAGLGAAQNMFTPNALDVAREQAKLSAEEDARRRGVWNQNLAVAPVNINMRPRGLLTGGA